MTQFMQLTAVAIWIITLALALFGWLQYLKYRQLGTVRLTYEDRRAVPWGLVHLLVIVLMIFVFGPLTVAAIGFGVWGQAAMEDSPILWFALGPLGMLLAWIGVMFAMRPRCRFADLGLGFKPRDFVLGAFTFAMLVFPMFALQWSLSHFNKQQHPLIESLIEDSGGWFFIVGGFAAVIVAPVVEEFVFRVFLQGWLENLAAYRQAVRTGMHFRASYGTDLFWGLGTNREPFAGGHPPPEKSGFAASDVESSRSEASHGMDTPPQSPRAANVIDLDTLNPYSSPLSNSGSGAAPLSDQLPMRPAFWPILVSASAFSAMHIGHGPAPIPLFFLALALGVLYQRTHRVWPCVTVHCLLNFFSLFNLWVILNTPELADQLL